MRRSFIINILIIFPLFCSFAYIRAQELTVIKLEQDIDNLAGRTKTVLDKKDNPCALLSIAIPSLQEVSFSEEAVQATYEDGVYSVYVPTSTKSIKIFHPNYLPLKIKFKDYQIKLEEKCTYSIFLAPAKNVRNFLTSDNKQAAYVAFHLDPSESIITINGERLISKRGDIIKLLPVGNYQYQATAEDFHVNIGEFNLAKGENTKTIDIKLKPTFGWVSFIGDEESTDSDIYIDGKNVGKIPMTSGRLKSGTHSLVVKKDMYKTYEDILVIEDDKTAQSSIKLSRNFSLVNIGAKPDVEIWINDTLKSRGSWTGRLLAGKYKIEAKRKHCITSTVYKDISIINTPIEIDVPDPIEKHGILNLYYPAGASVWINDSFLGTTPISKELMEGSYKVTVKKEGYEDNVAAAVVLTGMSCSIYGRLVPLEEAHRRQIYEDGYMPEDSSKVNVLSVMTWGHHPTSPMNMFDENASTSFLMNRNEQMVVKFDRPLRYICHTNLLLDPRNSNHYNQNHSIDTLSCKIVGWSVGKWMQHRLQPSSEWQEIDCIICSGSGSSASEFDSVILDLRGKDNNANQPSISEIEFWGMEFNGKNPLINNLYDKKDAFNLSDFILDGKSL